MSEPDDLILDQHYLGCLSQASYLIGDRSSGRAVVVDPQRDVTRYLRAATDYGLRIERVIQTHVHADFVSGHRELAAVTGATVCFGPGAEVDPPVELLSDRQRLNVGAVELEVLHTPGHTPESICLLVRERPGAAPHAVLTGDTLFVGDVGRPDLVGDSDRSADTAARELWHSVRSRLLTLPDTTRVLPGHGPGSACGRAIAAERHSTIGAQRRSNSALSAPTEEDFVARVAGGLPAPPPYFAHAAHRNRAGHRILDQAAVPRMRTGAARAARVRGAVLLDTRHPEVHAAGHHPGSVNVGLDGRFAETVGRLLGTERPIVLVAEPERADEARDRLGRIGFDRVIGWLPGPGPDDDLSRVSRLGVEQLARELAPPGQVQLVDVREPGETAATPGPDGALAIPLPELLGRHRELRASARTVTVCAGGYRSAAAASLLRWLGFGNVADLRGGLTAWHERLRGAEVR